jgi:hypothetical protein
VDYDTYLFVDNLKDYLRPLDPSKELYLGHNVYQHVHKGGPVFNQGGATVFAHATLDKMGRCVLPRGLLLCCMLPQHEGVRCEYDAMRHAAKPLARPEPLTLAWISAGRGAGSSRT